MNDPLRDNRIFPEEMQQKPIQLTKDRSLVSWLLPLIVVITLLLLAWFGYKSYTNNQNTDSGTSNVSESQQKINNFNAVQQASPNYTTAQRDKKVEVFFGTNN